MPKDLNLKTAKSSARFAPYSTKSKAPRYPSVDRLSASPSTQNIIDAPQTPPSLLHTSSQMISPGFRVTVAPTSDFEIAYADEAGHSTSRVRLLRQRHKTAMLYTEAVEEEIAPIKSKKYEGIPMATEWESTAAPWTVRCVRGATFPYEDHLWLKIRYQAKPGAGIFKLWLRITDPSRLPSHDKVRYSRLLKLCLHKISKKHKLPTPHLFTNHKVFMRFAKVIRSMASGVSIPPEYHLSE